MPSLYRVLRLLIALVVATYMVESFRIGGYEIDFSLRSLLGTDDGIPPEEYARALQASSIQLKTLKIPSTFLYIYPTGGFKREIYNKMQDLEVEAVEKALGIKFWKIGFDGLSGLTMFHKMKQAYTAPRRPVWWSSYYQTPRLSARRLKKQALDKYPLFVNLNTGRGITGMTAAVDLADLVLGNPVKKRMMPSLEDSPIQKKRRLKHSAFKMYAFEKAFGKKAILDRLAADRDRAYRTHQERYDNRKFWSRLKLARPLPEGSDEDDIYEDDNDLDNRSRKMQENFKVRSALGGSRR